jgi:FkbM family methyltransferase
MVRFICGHPLNRHARLSAMWRFVRWQVGSRMLKEPVVMPFVGPARLLVSKGMHAATGNLYTGLHEFPEMAFLLHLLRPGDVFLDVGANIGSYTVLAAAVVGAKCVAFEPVPGTFGHLLDNVSVNRIGPLCTCHNMAAGDRDQTVRFTADLDSMNHVCAGQENGRGIEVPVKRLDDMIGADVPTLIKIDVEGYEQAVLEGAPRLLANQSVLAVIVEMNASGGRYGFNDAGVHRRLSEHGFRPQRYRPFERKLMPAAGGDGGGDNLIYVRDTRQVKERLASAPPVTVNGRSF